MIEYTWIINQIDCHPIYEGLENVVCRIHWRLAGVDGAFRAEVYGAQAIAYDPESEFILFDDLTEELAVEWLENAIGAQQVDRYKGVVAAEIDRQANPPVVTMQVPWGN